MRSDHIGLLCTISSIGFIWLFPLFTHTAIHPFLPLMIYIGMQRSIFYLLWASLIAGFCMDLVASYQWGITIVSYCLTAWIFFSKKKIPYYSLSIYLVALAAATVVTEIFRSILFFHHIQLMPWLYHTFFLVPITTTAYGIIVVSLPLLLWQKIGKIVILLRRRKS
jgi:hypothetical protein